MGRKKDRDMKKMRNPFGEQRNIKEQLEQLFIKKEVEKEDTTKEDTSNISFNEKPLDDVIAEEKGKEIHKQLEFSVPKIIKRTNKTNVVTIVDRKDKKIKDIRMTLLEKRKLAIMDKFETDHVPLTIDEFYKCGEDGTLISHPSCITNLLILSLITWNNGLKEELYNTGIIKNSEELNEGFHPKHMLEWYVQLFPNSADRLISNNVAAAFTKLYNKIEFNSKRNETPIGFITRTKVGRTLTYSPDLVMSQLTIEQVRTLSFENQKAITLSEALMGKKSLKSIKSNPSKPKVKLKEIEVVDIKSEPIESGITLSGGINIKSFCFNVDSSGDKTTISIKIETK